MIRNKLGTALRDMHEGLGDKGTRETIREMLANGDLQPEDFSLQEMWNAFERDKDGMVRDISEAVSSDMFPIITGEIINAKVISAYDAVSGVGDQLVTVAPSKMEIETYAGFGASEGPLEVLQGAEYEDSDITEKYAQVPHTKWGRLISVTEEMIYFDKTNQIIMRANRIGQKAAQKRERLIVEGVQDIDSNVYRPSGTPTAFYRTSASGDLRINSRASTPFGEDGILQATKLFHNMTDEESDFIMLDYANLIALLPWDLYVQAVQMVNSALVPEGNENAVNPWKKFFNPVYSPYVTAQSATTWYLGDFKEDFVWSEIWPLQVFTMKPGNEMEFRRDIKSIHKCRFYGQVGAIDHRHCLKLTA